VTATAPGGWQRFERRGHVRASRLTGRLAWTTAHGDSLAGEPGDWQVSDGQRTWTVKDDVFRRTYERAGEGFRRRGTVLARPGSSGEIVQTLEGQVVVRAGDWVVRGEHGDEWAVPADHFAAAYKEAAE
jgi:uncharacterized cupin superfamily protein